jgi:hypothetical protein
MTCISITKKKAHTIRSYGTGFRATVQTLYAQGGVRRFYRGLAPALLTGPLARFGDTAANSGVLALFEAAALSERVPLAVQTGCGSVLAAAWRVVLMPLDTLKTMLQVEGAAGSARLRAKVAAGGVGSLYHGAAAACGATFGGHYPWFLTFNALDALLPPAPTPLKRHARNAVLGLAASVVADTTSNSLRVAKVMKQTNPLATTYTAAVRLVLREDGLRGLLLRGLGTRLLANSLQGVLFTVLWRALEDRWGAHIRASVANGGDAAKRY